MSARCFKRQARACRRIRRFVLYTCKMQHDPVKIALHITREMQFELPEWNSYSVPIPSSQLLSIIIFYFYSLAIIPSILSFYFLSNICLLFLSRSSDIPTHISPSIYIIYLQGREICSIYISYTVHENQEKI